MRKYLVLLVLFASLQVNAAVISLVPSTSNLEIGDNLTLDVIISQLAPGGAPALSGFDLNLNFLSSILSVDTTDLDIDGVFDSTVLDPSSQLDLFGLGFNFFGTQMLSANELRMFDLSFDLPIDLDTFQLGSFKLAEIQMQASQAGSSNLSITVNGLTDSNGNPLAFTTNNAQITVNGVPVNEPAMGFLSALIFVGVLRRRRQAIK